MYKGICFGGPMHGQEGESRFPKGFLFIDKPERLCWIYEWNDKTQSFAVRDTTPTRLDEHGRHRAAAEFNYDVRSRS